MPKFLLHGTYTQTGLAGLLKEGGTGRFEATRAATESLGGTLEAYYFAFGDNDFYALVDLPDRASALAASLVGNASGAIHVHSVPLITPAEMDEAVAKKPAYRPPGH